MTDVPGDEAYRDWTAVDGDADDDIKEICRTKGVKLPEPGHWMETSEGMTTPHLDVRALVIRWPGPASQSHVRITKKEGPGAPYILNPGLENKQSIVVVLGEDKSVLIVGKLHVRCVRSRHRPW